jgi:hypothetical protein
MDTTTIKLYRETKSQLDLFREYKNESYDEVIKKLLYIAKTSKTEPWRSKETVRSIELARERVRRAKFLSEEEATKKMGL